MTRNLPILEEERVLPKDDFHEELGDIHEVLEECHTHNGNNFDGKNEETKLAHRNGCHMALPGNDSLKTTVSLINLENEKVNYQDTLHKQAVDPQPCSRNVCKGSLYKPIKTPLIVRPETELMKQSSNFLKQYFDSLPDGNNAKYHTRLEEVKKNIAVTGSYNLTYEELAFGAKTAWRNAPRCIGRIQYSNLKVFDYRHVHSATEMFEAICSHLEYATNNGNLRSAITVFPHLTSDAHPFRVWNGQLIGYAGYKNPDGSVTGDPSAVEFTDVCKSFGWEGAGTDFDILPLLLQANEEDPELFEIPPHLVAQVPLKHPKFPCFEELGLKWYALPAVTNMSLDCGGLLFTAVPFNGWYMSSEIGRDLCDVSRYNKAKVIAEKMKLDTSTLTSLWMDQVVVEVNIAILHSFQQQGITITDHHSAAASFLSFMENEHRTRGGCPADWVWIVPPLSGSTMPVFHQEMLNYKLKPSYEYMEYAWLNYKWSRQNPQGGTARMFSFKSVGLMTEAAGRFMTKAAGRLTFKAVSKIVLTSTHFMTEARSRRIPATVVYATETGRSERFARKLYEDLDVVFRAKLIRMDEYDIAKLSEERMLYVVTSTFGEGEPPNNGKKFFNSIRDLIEAGNQSKLFADISFTVFGVGSRAYPKYCAAAFQIDQMLSDLGMKRIHKIGVGDTLQGQEASFEKWSRSALRESCTEAELEMDQEASEGRLANAYEIRIVPISRENLEKIGDEFVPLLSTIHSKKVFQLILTENKNLQSPISERRTNLVILSQSGEAGCQIPDYQPGDHLGVFPKNDNTRVQKILEKTVFDSKNLSADDLVRVESKKQHKWIPETRLPPTTLRVALTYLLDIMTTPDQMFLEALAALATDKKDKAKLDLLSQNADTYEDWKVDQRSPLDVVLEEFRSVKIPAVLLLSHLPLLQPRYYSLSSSINVNHGQAHLTVGVVEYYAGKDNHGPKRLGLCSTWLESLKEGDKVPVIFRANDYFHLPLKSTEPMILIGAGTGIAPFMSFFYQRRFEQSKGKKCGKVVLYFGCRRKDHDLIYKEEIQQLLDKNVISEFRIALSRAPDVPKTYVQDLIRIDAVNIYNQIVKEYGHVYVCGNINMAQRVEEELCLILCEHGNMTHEGASDFIERMCQKNRYHKDIY